MQEAWVRSLGREDALKEKATHSSILAWRIPWTVCKESDTTEQLNTAQNLTDICAKMQWYGSVGNLTSAGLQQQSSGQRGNKWGLEYTSLVAAN